MTVAAQSKAKAVSSFIAIKGTMIQETYAVLAGWDSSVSKKANLDRLRSENFIGAKSSAWLRDVAKALSSRLRPEDRDRALVVLARGGCPLHVWTPIFLWHITRDEFLLRDFLANFLYPTFRDGALVIRTEDVHHHVATIRARGGEPTNAWTESTQQRVANGLLRAAVDFGLVRGTAARHFTSYHLPEQSFLYLLHAMREHTPNPDRMIQGPDWRIFLMAPQDVERELLRLHQFKKLGFEAAGSLAQLDLPCGSAIEYAQRMVA